MIVDGTEGAGNDPASTIGDLLAFMTKNPAGRSDDMPDLYLRSIREREPVNEFGNTDTINYFAHPTCFPFGRGLPENSSALSTKIMRHVLLQESCRHAQNQQFYFANFDRMQRHTASRTACFRIKNNRNFEQVDCVMLVTEIASSGHPHVHGLIIVPVEIPSSETLID